jgi:hypothetical protein
MKMPDEVVQQCELECGDGGEKIVAGQQMVEECESGELDGYADEPDEIKFEPVGEGVLHGRGSSR